MIDTSGNIRIRVRRVDSIKARGTVLRHIAHCHSSLFIDPTATADWRDMRPSFAGSPRIQRACFLRVRGDFIPSPAVGERVGKTEPSRLVSSWVSRNWPPVRVSYMVGRVRWPRIRSQVVLTGLDVDCRGRCGLEPTRHLSHVPLLPGLHYVDPRMAIPPRSCSRIWSCCSDFGGNITGNFRGNPAGRNV